MESLNVIYFAQREEHSLLQQKYLENTACGKTLKLDDWRLSKFVYMVVYRCIWLYVLYTFVLIL
jgi:hypothetical protein